MYIGIAIGFVIGYILAFYIKSVRRDVFTFREARIFGAKGRRTQQERAKRRKERIYNLAVEKGRIVNDDAEDLFCISDSTANRYLRELVQEGRLEKHGDNRSTFYTPKENPPTHSAEG